MTDKTPLVTVIMNCRNSAKYLRGAIDSVYAQTYQNFEVVFLDNRSEDGSADIAKSYDKRLKYHLSDSFVPLYNARNQALAHCQGEFIAFLDCDDLWMPEKLERQIPLFSDPKVGLVYSDSIFFTNEKDLHKNYDTKTMTHGACFNELLQSYHLDIETVVIRKSVIDEHSLTFDATLDCVGDMDFFLRLARITELKGIPLALAKWRIHSESLTSTKQKQFQTEIIYLAEKIATMTEGDSMAQLTLSKMKRNARIKKGLYLAADEDHKDLKVLMSECEGLTKLALYGIRLIPAAVVRHALSRNTHTRIKSSAET